MWAEWVFFLIFLFWDSLDFQNPGFSKFEISVTCYQLRNGSRCTWFPRWRHDIDGIIGTPDLVIFENGCRVITLKIICVLILKINCRIEFRLILFSKNDIMIIKIQMLNLQFDVRLKLYCIRLKDQIKTY